MDSTDASLVIIALERGLLDEYLEEILAAAHNRKNVLRTGRSRRIPRER